MNNLTLRLAATCAVGLALVGCGKKESTAIQRQPAPAYVPQVSQTTPTSPGSVASPTSPTVKQPAPTGFVDSTAVQMGKPVPITDTPASNVQQAQQSLNDFKKNPHLGSLTPNGK